MLKKDSGQSAVDLPQIHPVFVNVIVAVKYIKLCQLLNTTFCSKEKSVKLLKNNVMLEINKMVFSF